MKSGAREEVWRFSLRPESENTSREICHNSDGNSGIEQRLQDTDDEGIETADQQEDQREAIGVAGQAIEGLVIGPLANGRCANAQSL